MLLLFVCCLSVTVIAAYEVPNPEIQVFKPSGFKVSIPAEDGIQLFAFHGNLNKKIVGMEVGDMSGEIMKEENGKFTVYDKNLTLRNGDAVYYWLYVQHNDLGYRLENAKFIYHDINETKKRPCRPVYKSNVDPAAQFSQSDSPIRHGQVSVQGQIRGSNGLQDHPENQHFLLPYFNRPNYRHRQWHSYGQYGHWPHYHQGSWPLIGHWQTWTRGPQQHFQRGHDPRFYFQFDPTETQQTDDISTEHFNENADIKNENQLTKRSEGSEEEIIPQGSDELETNFPVRPRFGFLSGRNPNADHNRNNNPRHYLRPERKHHRGHGYGYGHGHGYGYGHRPNFNGLRPHGPPPHHPSRHFPPGRFPYPGNHYYYPDYKGDDSRYEEYPDCEDENNSSGEINPPQPTTDVTTKIIKTPVVPITSPSVATTDAPTSTSTVPSSTYPQIDIRFGEVSAVQT